MAITYSISGGADQAKFNIDSGTGKLTFKTAPDFEKPGDANSDNVYEVQVKATDAGGASSTQDMRVTVKDVSENLPPQITSAAAVAVNENQTAVTTVTATDPDEGGGGPPPVLTGWPDASNTGVPAGTQLTNSGSITTSAANQVISGKNITGNVVLKHNNCVLEKCKIKGNSYFTVDIKNPGCIVRDCEIDSSSVEGSCGINGIGTFQRNNIHHCENGINVWGNDTLIEDNYIHDQASVGSPHYDGIQVDGGNSNLTIRHNSVQSGTATTGVSAVMIDNYFGPVDNVLVDNNRLTKGGFNTYCDGQFSGGSISNVRYTNNHMGDFIYGYTNFNQTNPVFTGNVDVNTGKPINATAATKSPAADVKPHPRKRD